MHRVRVMSWNLNARRVACGAQVEVIAGLAPDVLALQEVTAASWRDLAALLPAAGLPHVILGAPAEPPSHSRGRVVALASRWPLAACAQADVPHPQLVVCARVDGPGDQLEVIAVHVPTWANGRLPKVLTEEGITARARAAAGPLLLLGDFNAPFGELADGTVRAFSPAKDVRAVEAELGLTGPGLASAGIVDAFRAVHGYGVPEASWYWKNRGRTGGFRLDHVLTSAHLRPVACWYEHGPRESGLSDHSPIVADLDLGTRHQAPGTRISGLRTEPQH